MNYMESIKDILKKNLPESIDKQEYRQKVFDLCNRLQVGESRRFSDTKFVKPHNLPLFIQCINEFVKSHNAKVAGAKIVVDEKNCLIVKRQVLPLRRQRKLKNGVIQNSSNDRHPLALNILKFQRYNFNFFSCEEVVFFEYITFKGMKFKDKWFYHSSETIRREAGIKKHSLNSILQRFQQMGILEIEVRGMPRVKYFSLNYSRVMELLPQIFLLNENGQLDAEFRQLLYDFFQPFIENSK
jgi:hypothetical protein